MKLPKRTLYHFFIFDPAKLQIKDNASLIFENLDIKWKNVFESIPR